MIDFKLYWKDKIGNCHLKYKDQNGLKLKAQGPKWYFILKTIVHRCDVKQPTLQLPN